MADNVNLGNVLLPLSSLLNALQQQLPAQTTGQSPALAQSGAQPQTSNNGSGQAAQFSALASPTTQAPVAGTIISGVIVGRESTGNLIMQTLDDEVSFSSDYNLSVGSQVSVAVQPVGGTNVGQVLTANGEPPQDVPGIAQPNPNFVPPPSQETTPAVNFGSQNTATPATIVAQDFTAPGTLVTGTLIAQQAANAPYANPAIQDTQVSLRVVPDSMVAPAPAAPSVSAAAVTTLNAPSEDLNNGGASQSYVGQQELPDDDNLPQSQPSPVSVQVGQTFTATVIGNSADGETVIDTPMGLMRLSSGSVQQSGANVSFQVLSTNASVLSAAAAASGGAPLTAQSTPVTQLAQQWGALQQIFTLLSGKTFGAGMTSQLSNEMVNGVGSDTDDTDSGNPTSTLTSQGLTSGLLNFVSALKSDNFKQWIGDRNTKWLQDNGHDDLLTKAQSDFHTLSRLYTHPSSQHWQSLFFPVNVQGQLQQLRIFVKQDDKKEQQQTDGKNSVNTRFVIEVDLSKLGEIQMDGFVRKSAANNVQFDMMVRSLHPLTQEMQNDIQGIYASTAELTGYKGSIGFQTVKTFPINPMDDIVAQQKTINA